MDWGITGGVRKVTVLGVGVALAGLAACGPRVVAPVGYRLPNVTLQPMGAPPVQDVAAEFANVFCETLDLRDPMNLWGGCSPYLEGARRASTLQDLPLLRTDLRVRVVAGIFSECMRDGGVTVYKDALAHLRDKGVDAEEIVVSGLGSSEHNGDQIAAYLRANPARYILVGYSKGAADLMAAVTKYPELRPQIAALVTVAGAVGGSRLPDVLAGELGGRLQAVLAGLQLRGCDVGDGGGLRSLTRLERQRALAIYPAEAVPAFSLVAVASEEKTSRILKPFRRQLLPYSTDQDSQVIAEEAIVPGARYLGAATADHWAVALPFSTANGDGRLVSQLVDRNEYPRAPLLEAIVRFVGAQLGATAADGAAPADVGRVAAEAPAVETVARSAAPPAEPVVMVPPEPAPIEQPEEGAAGTPAVVAEGAFTIQVVALRDREKATSLSARLVAKGYDAYVVDPAAQDRPRLYKVRVGRFADRASADVIARQLHAREGFEPWITR